MSSLVASAPPQLRPFIKWVGGKRQLLGQYQSIFPDTFQRYHEPFLGGGAVFFHLQPQAELGQAILSDVNPSLIQVYCCVRDRVEDVLALLEAHQAQHCKEHYYDVRSQHHLPPVEHTARFIYLNKTCFNGLYRENLRGQFNVPMGRYKKPAIFEPERLRAASQALQNAEIREQDFTQVLHQARDRQDFVYFDPPYYPISPTSNFTSYSKRRFGAQQQHQLHQVFVQLAEQGVKVMLSNSDCEFVRELYDGFEFHPIFATRSINSKGDRRGKIREVVVTSYPVSRD